MVREWKKTDRASASHLNELVKEINRLGSAPLIASIPRSPFALFQWHLGKVVAEGPPAPPEEGSEEPGPPLANFTDARYWVKWQRMTGGNYADAVTLADAAGIAPQPDIVCVTNLPEWVAGTHLLAVGALVWFFVASDTKPNPSLHYLTSTAVAGAPLVDSLVAMTAVGMYTANARGPGGQFAIDPADGTGFTLTPMTVTQCYVVNFLELNGAMATHDLGGTDAYPAVLLGRNADGKPVYGVWGFPTGPCPTGGGG